MENAEILIRQKANELIINKLIGVLDLQYLKNVSTTTLGSMDERTEINYSNIEIEDFRFDKSIVNESYKVEAKNVYWNWLPTYTANVGYGRLSFPFIESWEYIEGKIDKVDIVYTFNWKRDFELINSEIVFDRNCIEVKG